MKPYISDFVLGSLMKTEKYIEVPDGYFITAKQIGGFQRNMRDDNGKLYIWSYKQYYLLHTCVINYFPLLC